MGEPARAPTYMQIRLAIQAGVAVITLDRAAVSAADQDQHSPDRLALIGELRQAMSCRRAGGAP